MTRDCWLLGVALASLGCGRTPLDGGLLDDAPANMGSSGHAGTALTTAGTGGSLVAAAGGTGGVGGTSPVDSANLTPAGYPRCGELDTSRADDCDGIDLIEPLDPDVSSLVDGSIEVGLSASVSVWVRNGDDVAHDYQICVGAIVDTPGITLEGGEDGTNPILLPLMHPGATVIVSPAYFHVRNVEPGTTARFTTWTTYEGTNCMGPTATVDALVR